MEREHNITLYWNFFWMSRENIMDVTLILRLISSTCILFPNQSISRVNKRTEKPKWEMQWFLESFGGWHEVAVTEVERLGAALARQSGQNEDEAVRHLWGKLAILLQRGNAAILGNRVPDFPAPAIDGRH